MCRGKGEEGKKERRGGIEKEGRKGTEKEGRRKGENRHTNISLLPAPLSLGSAVSPRARFGVELQPKSNLVHFNLNISDIIYGNIFNDFQ